MMFGIRGLLYFSDYLSQAHHDDLVATIDAQPWRDDLARRTQHYGYLYDYRAKTVDLSTYLGELPPWLHEIVSPMYLQHCIEHMPDQAITNEYLPGQGIASHIDCVPCFGNAVISVSLGSAVVMDFKRQELHVPVLLAPRSVVIFRSDARYEWTHGIAKRRSDRYNNQKIQRGRRISITFRTMFPAEFL